MDVRCLLDPSASIALHAPDGLPGSGRFGTKALKGAQVMKNRKKDQKSQNWPYALTTVLLAAIASGRSADDLRALGLAVFAVAALCYMAGRRE